MQDAIFKAYKNGDKVFAIFVVQELPHFPLLIECEVDVVARVSSTDTYYHLIPNKVYEAKEFIDSKYKALTFRTINERGQIRNVQIDFDKFSNLNWCQQFVTNYPTLRLDCNMRSVFETYEDAKKVIHTLQTNLIAELNDTITALIMRQQ